MASEETGTVQLALELAELGRRASAWEPPHAALQVAREHALRGYRAVLELRYPDGRSSLADFGRLKALVSPAGLAVLAGRGLELAARVTLRPGTRADVLVEAFLDGLPHGFSANFPSKVEIAGRGMAVRMHVRGLDVTDLFEEPVRTLADADRPRAPGRAAFLPDASHSGLVSIVRLAEARGEAIVLSTLAYPDALLARGPGAERYSLRTSGQTSSDLAAWSACRTPVLTIRPWHGGWSAARRVCGTVEGEGVDRPGTMLSILRKGREQLDLGYFRQGCRLRGPEPAVADRVVRYIA